MAEQLTNHISTRVVQDRFPVGENMYLLFKSDIFLLKTHGGRNRRPNFVIFVIWSALFVGGREGRGALKLHVPFWGDCCWKV